MARLTDEAKLATNFGPRLVLDRHFLRLQLDFGRGNQPDGVGGVLTEPADVAQCDAAIQ